MLTTLTFYLRVLTLTFALLMTWVAPLPFGVQLVATVLLFVLILNVTDHEDGEA